MKKKWIWRWIALACLGAMLAGCSDQGEAVLHPGTQPQEDSPAEELRGQETDEKEKKNDDVDDEGTAETAEHVALERMEVDPMELKDAWQRAAFFADWVYAQNQNNTLVSPLSLNMALGLAAEGAGGETARQLADYLGKEDYTAYVKEYLDFAEGLAREKESDSWQGGYSFHYEIANSLWVNQQHRLLSDYQKKVEESFRAQAEPADFSSDVAGTVQKINGWCDEKTHGMIPGIIKENDLSEELMAILINSLYFESPWVDKWSVEENSFVDFAGNQTTQDMLVGKGDFYYENDVATAFGKSYYNGFRFIGILPKQEGEFNLLNLDLESLLKSERTDFLVKARMPKLDFETTANGVEKILMDQGITLPFTNRAQFDKIIENKELHISRILQKCKIELDENGTKAAAVTAITMRANAIAPMEREIKEVYLTRPFAFLIYDSVNEEIVFVGKVTQAE